MKVQSVFGNIAYLDRTRKSEDSTQKEGSEAGYFQQQFGKKQEDSTPSEDEVEDALESFADDPSLQALGIEASTEGRGPGLVVTLKNGRGAVIRQFTGQEFVELRETAEITGRGKLLDKKL